MSRQRLGPIALTLAGALAWLLGGCSEATKPHDRPDRGPDPELPRGPYQLLVERYTRSGERSFYAMEADGARVAPCDGLPTDAVQLAPSPDGRRFAYLRLRPEGDQHLWLMDRDGTNRRPLLEGMRIVTDVAWSPDQRRLVYSDNTTTTTADIWVVDADGTGAVNLTPDEGQAVVFDHSPAWSPDGARIAFASNRTGITRVWTMAPDGRDPVQVLAGADSVEGAPAWSPDGAWLAFRYLAPGFDTRIAVARPDGSDLRAFAVEGRFTTLAWTPDGAIVYTADATGDFDVYRLDPETGVSANLSRHGDHDYRVTPIAYVASSGDWRGFGAPARYDTGRPGPLALAAGDATGDGYLDLLVLSSAHQDVQVLAGDGEGGFAVLGALAVGAPPRALALADVTRDGLVDVLVLSAGALHVWPQESSGGQPAAPSVYPVPGDARALAAADFDRDGSTDVAAVYAGDSGELRLRVFGANEHGDALIAILDFATGHTEPARACAADATGEGTVDIVTLTAAAESPLVLLPGHGDISFALAISTGFGLGSLAGAALCCADLDGDRRADVAVLEPGLDEGLRVLQATGDGFAPPTGVKVGGADLGAADVDRDGDIDLIVTRPGAGDAAFLRNLGDGRFAAPTSVALGGTPQLIALADVNGDGWPDLIAAGADGTLLVARNRGRQR
ncbi:MAG: FG-GAP-like repeat-containing protein [Candidatus Krumholzibacteria bacterium]|jgi:sugar lactone lactonase YvrE|nr:FG-GAP-like repeat-containing protein [Candidatus Krumholzibacteria bacterium]